MCRVKITLGLKSALYKSPAAVNYNGMIYKVMFSWIFALLLLTGCAVETARRETPAEAASEQQPGSKKDAYPTFTYRPGS